MTVTRRTFARTYEIFVQFVKKKMRTSLNHSGMVPKTSCTCCASILFLVQILFSFVFGMVRCDSEFEKKENKNCTMDEIEPQHT